jgi:hypothetical protein
MSARTCVECALTLDLSWFVPRHNRQYEGLPSMDEVLRQPRCRECNKVYHRRRALFLRCIATEARRHSVAAFRSGTGPPLWRSPKGTHPCSRKGTHSSTHPRCVYNTLPSFQGVLTPGKMRNLLSVYAPERLPVWQFSGAMVGPFK